MCNPYHMSFIYEVLGVLRTFLPVRAEHFVYDPAIQNF
jgi:hypothetical protein